MRTGPFERADEIGFEDSFDFIVSLLVLFGEVFVRDWFFRHRDGRCRCSCRSVSHRACQNVLPAKTHRRAATGNTVEPGSPWDGWGPGSLDNGPQTSGTCRASWFLRACHLIYT